jgi:hypothetical protein
VDARIHNHVFILAWIILLTGFIVGVLPDIDHIPLVWDQPDWNGRCTHGWGLIVSGLALSLFGGLLLLRILGQLLYKAMNYEY